MAKYHSPVPYFLLTALMGLVPVLNNKYPASFFPALSPGLVELIAVTGGILASVLGLTRLWTILLQKDKARSLVREAVLKRTQPLKEIHEDAVNAGRIVSRLVRNADEDLREIAPDFTLPSLKRLEDYLPALLFEMNNEEDAVLRLGIVGIYLGETLSRTSGWQWYFRADQSLKQFSYLVSAIRKGDREIDPFAWAGDLLTSKRRINDLLKESK